MSKKAKTVATCIHLTQVNKNYLKRIAKKQNISMAQFLNDQLNLIRKIERGEKKNEKK